MGEEGDDAEGKTEQRRRRAGDYAKRRGHGKDSPGTYDNRQNGAQPDGRAVTRAHANRLPEARKWNRPALVTFPHAGPHRSPSPPKARNPRRANPRPSSRRLRSKR